MASIADPARRLFAHPTRPNNIGVAPASQLKGSDQFIATAYGPPWGGIEGTGITAGGTRLASTVNTGKMTGPYIIAADPTVLPMGSQWYIWPNPFDYQGTFKVDDTGGAIKGHRIDFYDPLGRAHQNAWGRKNVTVRADNSAVKKGTAGFNADATGGDLGPGGPINFGGLDTGSSVSSVLTNLLGGLVGTLGKLLNIKTIIGIVLLIIGLARVAGIV